GLSLLGPTLTVDQWRPAGAFRARAVACAILLSLACRSISPRVSPAAGAPPAQLQHDIDAILWRPELERGYWGVLVKSLRTGETLYALNARKLMMPASNMKIVTLAAAIDRLGLDYSYTTRFLAAGPVEAGVLQGDVLVVGSGDPSFSPADGSADAALDACAERLNGLGVRTIGGRILGDDHAFDGDGLGFGWSWDD